MRTLAVEWYPGNYKGASLVLKSLLQYPLFCWINPGICAAVDGKSQLLIAADQCGRLAIWNLTHQQLRPTRLAAEMVIPSPHLPSMTPVLSCGLHSLSRTLFTGGGGEDCSIIFWRIFGNSPPTTLNIHQDPVVVIKTTESFLLSGNTHLSYMFLA